MGKEEFEQDEYYELGTGLLKDVEFSEVMTRFKYVTGFNNQEQLALALQTKKTYFRIARQKNIIPKAWVDIITKHNGSYNPLWILTGEGIVRTGNNQTVDNEYDYPPQ